MLKKKDYQQLELKEFIQEALVQIVKGVKNAQEDIKETNAEISPTGLHFTKEGETRIIFKPGRGIVQTVEFDVAITTIKDAEGRAQVGVPIGDTGLGIGGSKGKKEEYVNRIKFTVPILFTSTPYDWEKEIKDIIKLNII